MTDTVTALRNWLRGELRKGYALPRTRALEDCRKQLEKLAARKVPLPSRLESLAAEMESIAAEIEPINAEHASEMRGAASMARQWSECLEKTAP
jgi:predicted nuclease with TOPRIM domain